MFSLFIPAIKDRCKCKQKLHSSHSLFDLEQIISFQKWRTCNFWLCHCWQWPRCAGSNRLENVALRQNFLINIIIVVRLGVSFSSKLKSLPLTLSKVSNPLTKYVGWVFQKFQIYFNLSLLCVTKLMTLILSSKTLKRRVILRNTIIKNRDQ